MASKKGRILFSTKVEEGKKICEEYKSKWETGTNDTLQHKRDEKLTEILGDK